MSTPEEKRIILDRIYDLWRSIPDLRLGQLVHCSYPNTDNIVLFYDTDEDVDP